MNELTIGLAGNPNSGKTSLFNALTGLNQKVANFPGITVEKKTGTFSLKDKTKIKVIDLPGTYSLFPKSRDESIPFEILTNEKHPQFPDLVIYILDATNLKRNLLLLTQIIDLKIPVLVALNMVDQSTRKGLEINIPYLEETLGVEVIPIIARKGTGVEDLKARIKEIKNPSEKSFFQCEGQVKEMIEEAGKRINFPSRYAALFYFHTLFRTDFLPTEEQEYIEDLKKKYRFDSFKVQREEVLERYKKITEIARNSVRIREGFNKYAINEKLDKVLTHRIWGYVIFLTILFLIFQAIFSWATYPMELIELSFHLGSEFIDSLLPEGLVKDLLINGILAGLSGVLVFLPQIIMLFFFITLMEDTGYLSRVVFLMDKVMRRFGLSGKSVIPLMGGTACAVPAILATRNIENWKERLTTIMVTPLMSCSARIPVYILLIGLAVPKKDWLGFFNLQGLTLMGLYLLGFLAVIGASLVFKSLFNIKGPKSFIMEIPDYRAPRIKNIVVTSLEKAKTFIVEAGMIIIAISIILWGMASFGPGNRFKEIDKKYAAMEDVSPGIENKKNAEKLKASFAGELGRIIEPVIRPLGFDWKIGIAIITSFAAREVFVGTMATIYGLEGDEANFKDLSEIMRSETDPETNKPVYSLATVFSLLIFYAFAMQCMSTLAVTYKETNSIKYPILQFVFMTGLAYLSSFAVYQFLS